MNLTNTKRWKEFEDWYIENDYHDFIELHSDESWMDRLPSFVGLKFEFQEGVYRKFIESLGFRVAIFEHYWEEKRTVYTLTNGKSLEFNTFQELVGYFFNNE